MIKRANSVIKKNVNITTTVISINIIINSQHDMIKISQTQTHQTYQIQLQQKCEQSAFKETVFKESFCSSII